MPSLKYQFAHIHIEPQKVHNRNSTVTPQTIRVYRKDAIIFGEWCKRTYGARYIADCKEHVQDYADYLVAEGKSPSTIHKYLASVCRVLQMNMADIKKPPRITANNTRSRGQKAVDRRTDASREASPRLYDFARVVGIRRAEYAALRGSDFGEDAIGYYVLVRRGKGGRMQKQRIHPDDVAFVRSYFDGSENRVFSQDEMRNKIDLHHLRDDQGQRMYQFYADRIASEPGYRDVLIRELRLLWDEDNEKRKRNGLAPRQWKDDNCCGIYAIRGANRDLARQLGLPTQYDRLAVFATSVYHLAHWRLDVTVSNYLLAQ